MIGCSLLLHSPEGGELWIDNEEIIAVLEVAKHQDHLARGTHTVVYLVSGQKFGVRETVSMINTARQACDRPQ